jgi:hypothetical protein
MKGTQDMNIQKLRKAFTGAAIALALILSSGIIGTTAEAQVRGRYWQGDKNRRDDRSGGLWRQRAREMWLERQRERARNRNTYRYGNRRNYPYYGGGYDSYGRYGGYNYSEEQRGYRNGLKEGRDDAEDRDSFNPSRHSSFRDGNPSYRRGFYRGYEQGYREYARYRRW